MMTASHARTATAVTVIGLVIGLGATAQRAEAQADPDSTQTRRRIQPFPAIASAPETGLQLGATVLAVFEPASYRRARPASVVATAIRSAKGQTRLSVEGEHWSRDNARRLQGLLAWQRFPLPYYGIGATAPSEALETFTPTGVEAVASVQQRIRGAWYAVSTARFVSQDIVADSATGLVALDPALVGRDGGRVVELGAGLQRDSRDFLFNPTSGSFAQMTYAVSAEATGSEFSYQRLRVDARRYQHVGRGHVLALQALVIGTTGEAPFDQLALVGGGDVMRGYVRGRYRDRWLSAAQFEYRSPMRRRLGAVVFAGAGTVAARASDMFDVQGARVLPTYGGGLRVQIDARQRTAVRVDYGRGRDGASGLYIGFNQSF